MSAQDGMDACLVSVDTIVDGALQIVQQLICGASQDDCADPALLLRLAQDQDIAAPNVLTRQQLCISQLIRWRRRKLDLSCASCGPAAKQIHATKPTASSISNPFFIQDEFYL